MAKKKKKKGSLTAGPIGVIHSGTDGNHKIHFDAFDLGVGQFSTIKADTPKYANDKKGTLDSDAAALAADSNVRVIVAAGGSHAANAAIAAAQGNKPVIVTSVSSLTRPAPTVAGVGVQTTSKDPERLKLLLEMLPNTTKVGALYNKVRDDLADQKAKLASQASMLGLPAPVGVDVDPAGNVEQQVDNAFQFWATQQCKAAIIAADPLFNNHAKRIAKTSTNKVRDIPTIYQWSEFAELGGLISYGPNLSVAYALAGQFVGRLIGGTPIDQLPFINLDNFELVINLDTANKLGITVPLTLLARATHVIT